MITLTFRIKKYLPLLFTIFISTVFLSNCVNKNYQSQVDYDCVDRHYKKASRENTVNSFRNFLRKCTDKNNANYITA